MSKKRHQDLLTAETKRRKLQDELETTTVQNQVLRRNWKGAIKDRDEAGDKCKEQTKALNTMKENNEKLEVERKTLEKTMDSTKKELTMEKLKNRELLYENNTLNRRCEKMEHDIHARHVQVQRQSEECRRRSNEDVMKLRHELNGVMKQLKDMRTRHEDKERHLRALDDQLQAEKKTCAGLENQKRELQKQALEEYWAQLFRCTRKQEEPNSHNQAPPRDKIPQKKWCERYLVHQEIQQSF